ncbi:MAG: mechanosensitive ion channel family protein [Gemmatimonadota bacterium]
MEFLAYTFYGNSTQTWLLAALIAVVVLAVVGFAKSLVVRQLKRLADRTANDLDDLAAAILDRTKPFFLVALSLLAGAQALILPDHVRDIVQALVFIALLLQIAIWGNAAITVSLHHYTARMMEEDAASATTLRFVGFLLRLALWVLIALVALDTANVDITALIAGLGVGGIAVALATQNILGDLFASLSIVLDKPFVIGDFIIVGDMMGTVEHIGLKTTRIRSLSGEQLVFSNNDLLSSRIRNYKRMNERRILFSFGVVYQTSREQLERIPAVVREVIEAEENTRFDRAHFQGYGPSSLDFEVVYYMLVPDYNTYMDTQQAINLELFSRFEALGIEFAYPTQTVFVTGAGE